LTTPVSIERASIDAYLEALPRTVI